MAKRINVVGAVFIRNGTVLAAKRGPTKQLAGFWEFPGGKIEAGETATEALQRELSEELKVEVEIRDYLTTTEYRYDFGIVSLSTYLVSLGKQEPVLTEHVEMRWLTPDELFSVRWAPADVPAVELLAKLALSE